MRTHFCKMSALTMLVAVIFGGLSSHAMQDPLPYEEPQLSDNPDQMPVDGQLLFWRQCLNVARCRDVQNPCNVANQVCKWCELSSIIQRCGTKHHPSNCQEQVAGTLTDCGTLSSGICNVFGVCVNVTVIGRCKRDMCL